MADKDNQEPQLEDKEHEALSNNTPNLMVGENEKEAERRDSAANVDDKCRAENATKASAADPSADVANEDVASQQSTAGSSKPTKKSAKDYMPEEKWTEAHQVWAQALLALPNQEKTDSLRNKAKRMEQEPEGGGSVEDKHP